MAQRNRHHFKHTELKNNPNKLTDHHVPPRHPGAMPRPKIIRKERRHHEAYNLIFGSNCPDFATAVFILRRDWWTDENGNPINPKP